MNAWSEFETKASEANKTVRYFIIRDACYLEQNTI